MKFDTMRLLQDFNIPYIDTHSILTSNFVGIDVCPLCGASGGGKPYFAFSRNSNSCNCWICHTRDFNTAIKRLTGISDYKGIQKLYKKYGNLFGTSSQIVSDSNIIRPMKIDIPGSSNMLPTAKEYLKSRGFIPEYIWQKYSLKNTLYESRVPYRIVLPIIFNGRDISYTARSYVNGVEPRYISAKSEEEVIPHKDILYNLDNAKGTNVVVTEGPTDVWRTGNGFVASYGTQVTMHQLSLLAEKFENIFFLFDSGEEQAQKHAEEASIILNSIGRNSEIIEFSSGDPDEIFRDDPDELAYLKNDLEIY